MSGRYAEFFSQSSLMKKVYSMPTRVHFGEGALQKLPSLPIVASAQRIALCIGGSSLKASGHYDEVIKLLAGKDITFTEGVPSEPPLSFLVLLSEKWKQSKPDCIIAVGGGSVLDTAKAAAFWAMQDENVPSDLSKLPVSPVQPIPLVAVPTTSGTGSEVTPFSVFWDKDAGRNQSMHHTLLYPADALLDPLLTHSMPPAITAATGMDAFTQASEAYWNINANPVSDDYALMAIRRILPALPRAVAQGTDTEARTDMLLGSLQAGLAFSNTRTTACHSISYPMTLHFNVAHGQAVGITLPEVLLLNAEAQPERSARYCSALGATDMNDVAEKIRSMMRASGLATKLSELGIKTDADIELIVKGGFTPSRMGNTPYSFSPDSLRVMLQRIR